ncbi:MAG: translation initiation factor IF-2 [Candidatus Bipolaricaulota bacterium]|nr:translation initiation factor IF-2 [Candidatus Bipolaricaulota bacterium]MDW8030479.1 translation initiation factor IF-2 [Candidatus Bipolaricaulota bacterium]
MQLHKVAKELNTTIAELVARLETRGIKKRKHSFENLTEEEYKIAKELFAQPEPKPIAPVTPPSHATPIAPQPTIEPTPKKPEAPHPQAPASPTGVQPTASLAPAPALQAQAQAVAPAPPKPQAEVLEKPAPPPPPPAKPLIPRPPVVTILGHVDHGKTTLLDYIRKTHVAASEAGGITQSIGAYQVEYKNRKITFIDTPGHKAFANMRARGAQVTDIAVLVVAADDGVMEQTREAISHARAAKVPIIVAINKIDKPTANVQRVKEQLAREGLTPEDWGGETITVPISALTGQGVDELLEMILLVAELQELRADPHAPPRGVVIESALDPARGPIATVIVQEGTLRERDIMVCHTAYGRIRALLDDRGRRVNEAGPGSAVQVLGLSEVPGAGERFGVMTDLMEAKRLVEARLDELRRKRLEKPRRTIHDILQQQAQAKKRMLQIILKADSVGCLEAVRQELKTLKVESVDLEFLHEGVGHVNESDVLLASTAKDAVILGFRTGVDDKAAKLADQEGVSIKLYDVIYDLTDDVKRALQGLVAPQIRETKIGEAEIRRVFKIPNVGAVAGCYVRDGYVLREARVRVKRNDTVIFDGTLASLKHLDRDEKKIEKGKECGIKIAGFEKIEEGDILEFYMREVVRGF